MKIQATWHIRSPVFKAQHGTSRSIGEWHVYNLKSLPLGLVIGGLAGIRGRPDPSRHSESLWWEQQSHSMNLREEEEVFPLYNNSALSRAFRILKE